jgi:hypothetical protein
MHFATFLGGTLRNATKFGLLLRFAGRYIGLKHAMGESQQCALG